MLFLPDTNVISDLMRGEPTVGARLSGLAASDRVVTSTTVVGEVLYGITRLQVVPKRRQLELSAAAVLSGLDCEPIPRDAADHYARIKNDTRAKGRALDENDLWIAATALALGAVLVTRDEDFGGVPGLVTEDWTV